MKRMAVLFAALAASLLYAQIPDSVMQSRTLDSLYALYASFHLTDGVPRVGQEFTLTLSGHAYYDLTHVTVLVAVPNGVFCYEDSTKYAVSCGAGEDTSITVRLRVDSAGTYDIRAYIIMTDRDTLRLFDYFVTDFYIDSRVETAEWSNSPLDGISDYNPIPDSVIGTADSTQTGLLSSTVSGQFAYWVKDSGYARPSPGLEVRFKSRSSGATYETETGSDGGYSIQLPYDQYVVTADAKNSAGEVHGGWVAHINDFWAIINLSPATHRFLDMGLNVYQPSVTLNDTVSGVDADISRILIELANAREKMRTATGRTLDFLEVTYPPVCTLLVRIWGIGSYLMVVDLSDVLQAAGYAIPTHVLSGVQIKFYVEQLGLWLRYGVAATWRNPYQIRWLRMPFGCPGKYQPCIMSGVMYFSGIRWTIRCHTVSRRRMTIWVCYAAWMRTNRGVRLLSRGGAVLRNKGRHDSRP